VARCGIVKIAFVQYAWKKEIHIIELTWPNVRFAELDLNIIPK
jgi:hypothetical protein